MSNERVHHPYSPSTLQAREASPCYDPRQTESEASLAGTLQHEAFETRDLSRLNDEQAAAVTKCLDFFDGRLLHYRTTYPGKEPVVLAEAYLPIDDEEIVVYKRDPKKIAAFMATAGAVKTVAEGLARLKAMEAQIPVEPFTFIGTTAGYNDCAIISPDALEVDLIDLKFGLWPVEPAENNLQGMAYLLGLLKKFPTLKKVRVWFLMPYLDTMDTHVFEEKDFPALYLRIKAIVERARNRSLPSVPTTGTCIFCANIGKCEAVAKMALNIGAKYAPILVPNDIAPSIIAKSEDPGMVMKLSDLMKSWAEGSRRQITELAIETQTVPEGYRIKTQSKRKIIDKKKLVEIASRVLTPEEIDAATDISFGPLEKAISSKAPRGQKTETVEAFTNALAEEGATEMGEPYSFLEMIRQKPQ